MGSVPFAHRRRIGGLQQTVGRMDSSACAVSVHRTSRARPVHDGDCRLDVPPRWSIALSTDGTWLSRSAKHPATTAIALLPRLAAKCLRSPVTSRISVDTYSFQFDSQVSEARFVQT